MIDTRKFKYGKWLLIAFVTFVTFLTALVLLPHSVTGTYAYFDESEQLIGAPSFLVFSNDKVGYVNSGDDGPGKIVGEHTELSRGRIVVGPYDPPGVMNPPRSYVVRSRMFSIHFPKMDGMKPPWGRRLSDDNENSKWIRNLKFVRFTNAPDGTPIKEIYNSDLELVATDYNPSDFPSPD